MPPRPPLRVQLMIGRHLEYFRNVLLGVRHYGFTTGRVVFADAWLGHELDDLTVVARRDRIQGIIAQVFDAETERRFASLHIPVINISNSLMNPVLPTVTQDDYQAGCVAAEHLLSCGCASFGFWGHNGTSYSQQRQVGFAAGLAASGRTGVKVGRASCRERGEISVGAGSFKKKR